MSKTLIICEKNSQAQNLRKALGTRYGDILPAQGHLLTLLEPDDVRKDWKEKWSSELLWPGQFYGKRPVANTRNKLDAIQRAARGADHVIIATDNDREGQMIGEEILEYCGFKGRVSRAWFNAEDPKSLQDAFANLKSNDEYAGLFKAGQAREQSDQIANLSLTRTASVEMKAKGSKGAIGVGRVKSPVLGIMCRREIEIENFTPQDLFGIDATTAVLAGSMILNCNTMPMSLVREQEAAMQKADDEEELDEGNEALEDAESTRGKILDKRIADGLRDAVAAHKGPISSKSEKKRQGPPRLFDLTAMQSAMSSKMGWTGAKTLEVAQKIYDKGLITYPRGDSQYLPLANVAEIPKMVSALTGLSSYAKHKSLLADPVVRKGKSGHFDDKSRDGSPHHATVPNANAANTFASEIPKLGGDEAILFDVIAKQYLAVVAPDHQYEQTTIDMAVPWKNHDWNFRASGRVPTVAGWKEILQSGKKPGDEVELPAVSKGEQATVTKAVLKTNPTKPPQRYTEGSLLKVMKEVWRLVDDPEDRARLKLSKGIGTPATKAGILEGLLKQGQIANKGKALVPTVAGMTIFKTLDRVCPNVVDPARTAKWETLFDMVENGKITPQRAVAEICKSTQVEIDRIKANSGDVNVEIGGASKPTPKMVAAVKMIAERKGITPPRGYASKSELCREFLDTHAKKREKNADGTDKPFPPSEKQLEFASNIAASTGKDIPEDAVNDSKALSAWIEKTKGGMPAQAPSEKQINYARKLSEEKGEDLPGDAETDRTVCSAFIDRMMGGKGSSKGASGASRSRRSSSPSGPRP